MEQQFFSVSKDDVYGLMQECSKRKDLAVVRRSHLLLVSSGLDAIASLGEQLICLFAYCGSLLEANQAFCKVSKPSVGTWNAIISAHAKLGQGRRALELYCRMNQEGIKPNEGTFLCTLKACSGVRALLQGKRMHAQIIECKFEVNVDVGNALVDMYVKNCCLEDARNVFDNTPNRDAMSWSTIIVGYVQHGYGFSALELADKMHKDSFKPDRAIFSCMLKACGSIGAIEKGRLIHDQIIDCGLSFDLFFGNSLIDMYAKCGSLGEARKVFDELQNRDVVSWGAMIAGYAYAGLGLQAIKLFGKMGQQGMEPNKVTFLSILKACGSIGAIAEGKGIHHEIITSRLEPDNVIVNTLVDMYAKCGSLKDACTVFNKLQNRDEVSWGAMISGYAGDGHGLHALELFEEMQQEGIKPNIVNIVCILNVCGSIGALGQGRLVHEHIVKSGLQPDLVVRNCLIDMYAKCENLEEARQVFDELPRRDVVSWGSLIAGYAAQGHGFHALELFEKMLQEGVTPNRVIFLCILKACGSTGAIAQCRLVHNQITKSGLASDIRVGNTLIDMYAKYGNLDEAHNVFDNLLNRDVVSWGAMISGFAMHGKVFLAFDLYQKMQEEGILPNEIIFLGIIKACGSVETLAQGRQIHDHIISGALESPVVMGNALVDMYLKCGSLEEASNVFLGLADRDAVTWGAMIAGYAAHEYDLPALELYGKMQKEGVIPNIGTFSYILKACGSIGAGWQGRFIHDQIIRNGLEVDTVLGNSLVDMYTKCGGIEEACRVFNSLQILDEVSWGAIVAGYAVHGDWRLVEQCLNEMQQQGLKPGLVPFTSILASCSNTGLIQEGCWFFKSMREDYGLFPSIEHYSCMIDLLGRTGFLNEAEDVLQTMHIPPDVIIWRSLLTSSKTYGNEELGRRCFEETVQSDPWDASGYVLISNIYADADMWVDVNRMEQLRNCASAWKKPGSACIEVHDEVHEFLVGGKSHLQHLKIQAKLNKLDLLIKRKGFVPQLDLVLESICTEDRSHNK